MSPTDTSAPKNAALPKNADELRRILIGGYPIIFLITTEEERAAEMVRLAANAALPSGYQQAVWSVTQGLVDGDGKAQADTAAPHRCLATLAGGTDPGVFILNDLHPWLDDAAIVRHLRDFYDSAHGHQRFLVLLSPILKLPQELKKESVVIDLIPPTKTELEPILDEVVAKLGTTPPPEMREQFVRAVQGLTCNEARHVLAQTLGNGHLGEDATREIQIEKARLIRKEGILQFVPQDTSIDDVGGLENLKNWLKKRRRLFLDHADEGGELLPRGLLMMGISGCGKSLSVKAIAADWQLPLFRLDMTEVHSGAHGVAEAAFAHALSVAEALAPCVLWIDEIEGGITGYESGQGGSTWRIFSTFLTWMQEKQAPVFVAATANRIDLLPAEMLRKGRFDQIFFLDLPSEPDREEIFRVHLAKRDNDLENFDLSILARGSKGWNGAEVENCVVAGMIEAYAGTRPLTKEDLYDQLSEIVPLSTTMSEQIKAIRSWAHDRAVKAGL